MEELNMGFYDEKDYIMRTIKQLARALFLLIFGKQLPYIELLDKNEYEVSGKQLKNLLALIDNGEINDAENMMLSNLDYTNKDEISAATLFYLYLGEKEDKFLLQNNYSKEEVLDGLKQLVQRAGYKDLIGILE